MDDAGWPPAEWCDAGEPPRAEPGGAPGGGGGGLGACACATDAIGSGGVARAVASLRSLSLKICWRYANNGGQSCRVPGRLRDRRWGGVPRGTGGAGRSVAAGSVGDAAGVPAWTHRHRARTLAIARVAGRPGAPEP